MPQTSGKPGERVALEVSNSDASTTRTFTLKDANGATRTLLSTDRLLIDSLSGRAVQDNDDPSTDITVTVFGDTDADGNIDDGERVLVFSGAGVYDGGPEGYSLKIGTSLKVKASAAGQVDVTGMGRIVNGQTVGTRPSWKESLISGNAQFVNPEIHPLR